VVGVGIIGNLAGYPILDPIAAAIVGFMVAKMGWEFGWDAMHHLVNRAIDDEEVAAIRKTLEEMVGAQVDTQIEVDATLSVETGHDIAMLARSRALQRLRALKLMTHVAPWLRPDLDHASVVATAA
jgi:divalent metal cation (Fe/Co/Zn/Cd) transporter